MSRKYNKFLFASILRLAWPMVHILLRNGIAYGTFSERVREVYVDVAFADFAPEGRSRPCRVFRR